MATMVSFKKGLRAGLPATYAEGTFYVTTDERAIYLDVSDSARIRLGDFQEFATLDALIANTNPSTTALYYVADINCLAKWNGSEYVQINKDTGMTSVEVVGEGNAVTAAVYSADGRKLTLTKGATYMTAADVDSKISAADTELRAYVEEKTKGIATDAALGELQERVATAESEIDALQAAVGETGDVTKAIAAAQSKADEAAAAAAAAQSTADSKTTMAEVEAKDYATKTEAQGYANAKDEAIADMDAAYKAADSALETKLQGNIDKKVEQSVYDAKIAELAAADVTLDGKITAEATARDNADKAQVARIEALEGTITGLSGAMHFKGVETAIPEGEALAGYADGDVIIVGEKEYVFNGGAFVEFGDVSAEGDRISALETAIGDANGGLVKDIADNKAAIEGEAGRAAAAEGVLSGRIDALEAIDHSHENADVLNGITAAKVQAWDGAQAAAEATAAAALAEAKGELEGKINGVDAKFASYSTTEQMNAAIAAVDGKFASYSTTEQMNAAIKVEEDRAKGIEAGLESRLAAVEGDYLKAADKTELEGKITAEATAARAAEGALSGRLDVLEAIDHDAYVTADEQVLADAKAHVENCLTWGTF